MTPITEIFQTTVMTKFAEIVGIDPVLHGSDESGDHDAYNVYVACDDAGGIMPLTVYANDQAAPQKGDMVAVQENSDGSFSVFGYVNKANFSKEYRKVKTTAKKATRKKKAAKAKPELVKSEGHHDDLPIPEKEKSSAGLAETVGNRNQKKSIFG